MTAFFENLQTTLAAIPQEQIDKYTPEHPVEESDNQLGTLPEDIQRLYAHLRAQRPLVKEAEEKEEKASCTCSPFQYETLDGDRCPKAVAKVERMNLEEYEKWLKTAFWRSIHTAFPETLNENVGVRKDWVVVTFDSSRTASFEFVGSESGMLPAILLASILGRRPY